MRQDPSPEDACCWCLICKAVFLLHVFMYTEENGCTHDGSAFQQGPERNNNSYSFLKPLHKQNTNDVRYSDHVNTSDIYTFDFLNDIIILNLLTCLLALFYVLSKVNKVTSFSSLSSLMTTKYTGWDSAPYFEPSITTVYTGQSFSPYIIFTWSSICVAYIYIYIYIQSSDDHVQGQVMYRTSLPTPDDNSAHVR